MASALRCAARIVTELQKAGFETYLAGGCVRDIMLGRKPKDYDIATAATPDEVQQLIPDTKPIGKAFGVIQARSGGYAFEVATFRRDMDYKDGRRPSGVSFTNAKEDAERRDFTINSMFFDPASKTCIDYCGGIQDLQRRRIRTVGSPYRRFMEDHLRILRAVRFSQVLGFSIERVTAGEIRKHARLIRRISPERIQSEVFRILTEAPAPGRALLVMHRLKLLACVLPRTARSHSASQLTATASALDQLAGSPLQVLLTALFLRTGARPGISLVRCGLKRLHASTMDEMSALRISKALQKHVLKAQALYLELIRPGKIERSILPDLATPEADSALKVLGASHPAKAKAVCKLQSSVLKRLRRGKISGDDLLDVGVKPGPGMAKILNEAQVLQAEGYGRKEIFRMLKLS